MAMATPISEATLMEYKRKKAYIDAYENASNDFIKSWVEGNISIEDPFGQRSPTEYDQLLIGRAWLNRHDFNHQGNRGDRGNIGNRAQEISNLLSSSPSGYLENIDIRNRQLAMSQEMLETRLNSNVENKIIYSDTEALNYQIRTFLERNHPQEESFLRALSKELETTVIETILECIKAAMTIKALESNVVADINQELKQLEKEKGNGKLATEIPR